MQPGVPQRGPGGQPAEAAQAPSQPLGCPEPPEPSPDATCTLRAVDCVRGASRGRPLRGGDKSHPSIRRGQDGKHQIEAAFVEREVSEQGRGQSAGPAENNVLTAAGKSDFALADTDVCCF